MLKRPITLKHRNSLAKPSHGFEQRTIKLEKKRAVFQPRPTYFHGSLFAPGLALFSKYRSGRKPFTISNRYKAIVKPCWNHLTSNLGLLNVRCGAPFPRTRLSTTKRVPNFPGLSEKQIKRNSWSRIVQLRPNFRPRSQRAQTRRK